MLNNMERHIPLFVFGELNAKDMHKAIVDDLCLATSLRMKCSGILNMETKENKLCAYYRKGCHTEYDCNYNRFN